MVGRRRRFRYSPAMAAPARTLITEKAPWPLVVLLGSLTALGPLAVDMYLPSLPAIRGGCMRRTAR